MSIDILIVFGTLFIALILFATDWIRYDVVALLALLTVTISGVISPERAFSGFSEPAVIVVAAVLVVSRGVYNAGVADLIASMLLRVGQGITTQISVTNGIVGTLSGFMSNTGTLALFLPITMKIARERDRSASTFLMPLAASALLGGLVTLIGTPPNLIIASFRGEVSGQAFSMFDYTPVGLGVAVTGIAFICLMGWRLVPERQAENDDDDLFQIEHYTTQLRVLADSELAGKPISQLESLTDDDVVVGAVVRQGETDSAPSEHRQLEAEDIVILQINPDHLDAYINAGLAPVPASEEVHPDDTAEQTDDKNWLEMRDTEIVEAIMLSDSPLVGNTIVNADMRWRHGINLLAVARHNERIARPLSEIALQAGDILLFQGDTADVDDALMQIGCLPLQKRDISFSQQRDLFIAVSIFIATLFIVATGLLPVEVAFVGSAVVMILAGLVSLEDAYDAIQLPILILIGAMLPLGDAFEVSGGADVIANSLVMLSEGLPPFVTLITLFIVSLLLSNIVHNAAVASLLAPVAVSIANGLGLSSDSFLMAVAVSASCTFMTPIGHQANTIVMEVGGYKFKDYLWLGVPLTMLVTVTGIPLILFFWPLSG